jgi:hypothetical protein
MGSQTSTFELAEPNLKSLFGESKKIENSSRHVSKAPAALITPLRAEVRIRSDPNLLLDGDFEKNHKAAALNSTMDSDSFRSSLLQSTLDEEEDAPISSVTEIIKDSKTNINEKGKRGVTKSFSFGSGKEAKKALPPYVITKVEASKSVLTSGLSILLQRKADLNNPLAEQYAKFVMNELTSSLPN